MFIKKKGTKWFEKDIIEIEKFHKHCLDNVLAGCLWTYSHLWKFARKFRKKQKKLSKKANI